MTDRHNRHSESWYFQVVGQPRGPLTYQQLKQHADEGIVKRDTLVRKGISGTWCQAREVTCIWPLSVTPFFLKVLIVHIGIALYLWLNLTRAKSAPVFYVPVFLMLAVYSYFVILLFVGAYKWYINLPPADCGMPSDPADSLKWQLNKLCVLNKDGVTDVSEIRSVLLSANGTVHLLHTSVVTDV